MAKTESDVVIDTPRPRPKRNRPAPASPQSTPAAPPEEKRDRTPKILTFMEQVSKIPAADWGKRATIKVYRLDPVIDRLRTQDNKYIGVYDEPGVTEERIKQDYGSGRYRLYLNYKLPTTGEGKEIDSVEFDIFDMAYPPKIPVGEWCDSPHNKRWAWAKKILENAEAAKVAPPPPPAAPDPMAGVETFLRVQDRIAERMQPPPAAPQPIAADPVAMAMSIAEKFLTMRSDNPMIEIMRDEMKAMREETRLERQENMRLHAEMRAKESAPANNGVSGIKGVVGELKELLPVLKDVFPGLADRVDGAVSNTGRSRMNGWQEFLQPIAQEATRAMAPLAGYAIQRIFMTPTPTVGVPRPNPAGALPPGAHPQQPGSPAAPPPGPPDPLIGFINNITPGMLRYFRLYAAGSEEHTGAHFYDSVLSMFGETWMEKDWHQEANQAGVLTLVGLYKDSSVWQELAPNELKFVQFVTDFLSAAPDEEDDPILDLTADEGAESDVQS